VRRFNLGNLLRAEAIVLGVVLHHQHDDFGSQGFSADPAALAVAA